MPVKPRLASSENIGRINVRLPESQINWLELEGGGRRGAVSVAVRRLVKEEAWRREGRYVEMSGEECDRVIALLSGLAEVTKGRPSREIAEIRDLIGQLRKRRGA